MTARATFPTPYPDVNALLDELQSSVQTILGTNLVGMYLYGSLACGDFDEHSDIDFAVVTADGLSSETFLALKAMHERMAATGSKWAMELEGSYIPQRALRRYDPTDAQHPHIDRGGGLVVEQHDSDWIVQRHILRERGVVLTGPDPQTLLDPIAPNDLRRAALETLRGWWAPMLQNPFRLLGRGYQSYTVLTMCRILYTLQFGIVVSKPIAARWAQETLGEPWAALIDRAIAGRRTPQLTALSDDVTATLDLIRLTLERSQAFN